MTRPTAAIVAEHLAVWNSPPGRDRELSIARVYGEDVVVAEPGAVHRGRAALARVVDGLRPGPGRVVTATGPVLTTQAITTYPWAFGPADGPPLITGRDVLEIRDGRVVGLHVMLDPRET